MGTSIGPKSTVTIIKISISAIQSAKMAEFVQQHMESMADEMEEMKRIKLYTADEIRLILKSRKEFEYKINRVSKNLGDFKDYITYEKALLRQIHKRRDKSLISERKNSIEYKILKRIKNLYEIALQRFSSEFTLYLSYFKFCKQSNFINAASVAIQNMIKNCPQNPDVWLVAANWYVHDQKNLNEALKVLNKGLTILNKSRILYTEAIKLVLSTATADDPDEKKTRVCKKIETYVLFICEHIDDSDYLIEILNLLDPCGFTVGVQNFIINKLIQNYSGKSYVWHVLAQRERNGQHYGEGEGSEETNWNLCLSKYQEGLKRVSSEEKVDLWSLYLDCLVEAEHEENKQQNTIDLLKASLEEASAQKCLTERYYIKWLELVSDEEALHILQEGTNALPQSLDLWKLYLKSSAMTDQQKKVDDVFKQGKETLKERSLSLWCIYLRYYVLLSREDKIDETYREGIKQPLEISIVLKPRYVEWLGLTKGIMDARKMYNILVQERPYCKELHTTMSKLESAEMDLDFDEWERVHELACKQFGDEDVDVWINYILFHLHFKISKDMNEKVQSIHREAEGRLSLLLQSDFREKYMKVVSDQE